MDTQEDGDFLTYRDTFSEMDMWPGKCEMDLKCFFN